MKSKLNSRSSILMLMIGAVALIGCSTSKNNKNLSTDIKNFKVILERTDNGVKMHCLEGSAWTDLAFSMNNYQSQAIDEYGLTNQEEISSVKDSKLADFLFTITKTENEINLDGIEGTAWSNLSFTLTQNQKQAFDQNGMTSIN